jgi:uncharacterized membrane protein YhiD involved in acid resistance
MTASHFAINLASAFVCGAVIGVERQWRQRMAGLRTNTLVAVGAALFVLLAEMVTGTDATLRVAAQVVSGIGFLGAGVIMREGLSVRGLNTAATLWCSAAVGTLAGAGFLREALMGTLAVLVANTVLRPIGLKIDRRPADLGEATDVTSRPGALATCRPTDATSATLAAQRRCRADWPHRGPRHAAQRGTPGRSARGDRRSIES